MEIQTRNTITPIRADAFLLVVAFALTFILILVDTSHHLHAPSLLCAAIQSLLTWVLVLLIGRNDVIEKPQKGCRATPMHQEL